MRRAFRITAAAVRRRTECWGGIEFTKGRLWRAEGWAAWGAPYGARGAAAGVGRAAPVWRDTLLGLRVDNEDGRTGDRRLLQVGGVGLEGRDVARWRQSPVGQLVPGWSRGVLNLLSFGEGAEGMHTDRWRCWWSGYIVFWARVDLREGGQAPPLLRGVVEERLDLQVLHGGRSDGARWSQRWITMATSYGTQKTWGGNQKITVRL